MPYHSVLALCVSRNGKGYFIGQFSAVCAYSYNNRRIIFKGFCNNCGELYGIQKNTADKSEAAVGLSLIESLEYLADRHAQGITAVLVEMTFCHVIHEIPVLVKGYGSTAFILESEYHIAGGNHTAGGFAHFFKTALVAAVGYYAVFDNYFCMFDFRKNPPLPGKIIDYLLV